MLDLVRTFTGSPAGPLQYLILPHTTLILYPSADAIVVLDAGSLALVRVLAFQEIFPGSQHLHDSVSCIAVDPAMKIIVAAMNTCIAAWSLSGAHSDAWRVHSSLVLPGADFVTALDCRSGLLSVGSRSGLSVYTLILENDLLTWCKKWSARVVTPSIAKLAPTLTYIVTASSDDTQVRLYSTASGREMQSLPHPRPVTDLIWRYSCTSRSDDAALFTITSDSALRIFLPVIDSPHLLQLHLTLDFFSSLTFGVASNFPLDSQSNIVYLDKDIVGRAIKAVLTTSISAERSVLQCGEENWDFFLRVFGDGSILLSVVSNIDRKPPTLLHQFTFSHSPPAVLFPLPKYIYIFPHGNDASLTLVTSPPLRTFKLPSATLLNGRADSLLLSAAGSERMPGEESQISYFVRTPAGRGVAVVRASGGETWIVTEKGMNLSPKRSWSSADHVVVLDGGKLVATYSAENSILTLLSNPASTLYLPRISALFSTPSKHEHESIIGLTEERSILRIHITGSPPTLLLCSHNTLPLPKLPKLILPVDPMAWSRTTTLEEHDNLLSISEDGELCFWILEHGTDLGWRCTGRVRTGRKDFKMARCSSAKKSVIVARHPDGEELTIWDSNESEFASGLEHRQIFSASEPILDLDWTSTPDNQSILAIGFTHHVDLLCQQRKTYFDDDPGWTICWKIEVGRSARFHLMFLYGQRPSNNSSSDSLFVHVARHNGPLPDYHPQMLLQCLLWRKISLVKQIIVTLAKAVQNENFRWQPFPIEEYLREEQDIHPIEKPLNHYDLLFEPREQLEPTDDDKFSRSLVEALVEQLEARPLPHLTPNEHAHLIVLVQTTLEIDEQRRALDANGLRYVLSMRSFYILNRRIASDPSSPRSNGDIPRRIGWRERLRYRDMIWAFHSDTQDLLLNTSTTACNGKMLWSDARALGVFIWMNSVDAMKSHMETIARNEYMTDGNRDPTACSLFYFALGKVKLVHGLWRQAAWHKEQSTMLKFLANDFTQPRWRTAALKNAYALLSKQRFEYAAAFFLLGGSLKDAVNVCIKQLSDFQLAIALARVVEQGNDGPVLRAIINHTVLPIAFRDGNRWLGSWAFWILHRRDLSVRILLTPLQDLADCLGSEVSDIGEPHFDDPSLALLFSQLRSKTLQTATGTSEISGKSEFNFVLQVARVFCRMGCHALALNLVRTWSFERPTAVSHPESLTVLHGSTTKQPTSPTSSRRLHGADPFLRRRTSIMIDMDVTSAQPTRTLAKRTLDNEIKEEGDLVARKAGLGSLMISAKRDVQIPDFDINDFF
ncbi:RAVE protein 1 C terminal-domain-containing protein [Phlebopus sp. FC_14]|nr:RAVE protein 1 C terminal-domain-containing protein [Phlebopus sp. FC_14]